MWTPRARLCSSAFVYSHSLWYYCGMSENSGEMCSDCTLLDANTPQIAKDWAFDDEFESWRGLPENFGKGLHPVSLRERDLALACRRRVLLGSCLNSQPVTELEQVCQAVDIARQIVNSTDKSRSPLEKNLYGMPKLVLFQAATELFRAEQNDDYAEKSLEQRRLQAQTKFVLTSGFSPEDFALIWEEIKPVEA